MDDLLPHYERELAFLRGHSGDFARRYPKIAGRLLLSGDVGEDPHVERLIESFALLSSRIHKRLDDDFPLFTESFFEVLYPHYLRPFPSCTIASFDASDAAAQMSGATVVPRGTYLTSRPVKGVNCKFRTTYDVALAPIRVGAVDFRAGVSVPDGTALPKGASSMLSMRLELTSTQATWKSLGLNQIRVHLDGEASQVTALREVLCGKVVAVLVQSQDVGPWQQAAHALPVPVGFSDDEALIDTDARTQSAYRLLTEYFAFPEKFNFVDLPLPMAQIDNASRFVTLHFLLSGIRSDSNEAVLLETVTHRNLLLHCTPLVNLFEQRADPIRVTHQQESYPVLPDGRKTFGYEVYSIERVYRLKQTPHGEIVDEFSPFYSLQHSELVDEGDDNPRYWSLHRDETLTELSPGYETEISVVDINFNPARPQTDTLSIDLKATNRNLPSLLSIANQGGDLFSAGGSQARSIRMLRKPTPSLRFERGKGALWRLISHLALNHLSLSQGGLDAIKEMLRLYDLPRSATNRSILDGLVAIDYKAATAYLPGNPFATFVRGMEVIFTVDEQKFTGTGLRLFSQVLDHFFGLYVHVNSFTQLKLISSRTQEELIACPRRSGSGPLL